MTGYPNDYNRFEAITSAGTYSTYWYLPVDKPAGNVISESLRWVGKSDIFRGSSSYRTAYFGYQYFQSFDFEGTSNNPGGSSVGSYDGGEFANGYDRYFSLQLVVNSDTMYGWVLLNLSADISTFTVKEYAYSDVPNEPIKAGQVNTTGIESRDDNKASIYGFNRQIHISGTKGTATIYNMTGQRVHRSQLSGKETITLNSGVYLVKVANGKNSTTKKVILN